MYNVHTHTYTYINTYIIYRLKFYIAFKPLHIPMFQVMLLTIVKIKNKNNFGKDMLGVLILYIKILHRSQRKCNVVSYDRDKNNYFNIYYRLN